MVRVIVQPRMYATGRHSGNDKVCYSPAESNICVERQNTVGVVHSATNLAQRCSGDTVIQIALSLERQADCEKGAYSQPREESGSATLRPVQGHIRYYNDR